MYRKTSRKVSGRTLINHKLNQIILLNKFYLAYEFLKECPILGLFARRFTLHILLYDFGYYLHSFRFVLSKDAKLVYFAVYNDISIYITKAKFDIYGFGKNFGFDHRDLW